MVLPPLLIIVGLVAVPIGICVIGTYFAYKAYHRRERRIGKRPVRNEDIELGVLEPNNTRTQKQGGLEVHRTSASASTQPFGIALQIHGFDRVSAAASSSKIPQVAELDEASSLKQKSHSWATVHSRGDVSPPERFTQAITPPAQRSVSPLVQQWPPTHHHGPFLPYPTPTLTKNNGTLWGFQEVYEQPKRRDSQRTNGKNEKTSVGEGFEVLESKIGSLWLERRKSDEDRQKALDILEGNVQL
jgi:hypothetical protein